MIDAGLELDIEAPHPNAPSMTGAIEQYIRYHYGPDAGKEKNRTDKQNA